MYNLAVSALNAVKDIPLSVAAPAVTAAGAYLNAKYAVGADIRGITKLVYLTKLQERLEAADRVNVFYHFENLAKDPKSADRVWLVLPSDPSRPAVRTEWTYAEAYDHILKWAAWLKHEHNVLRGEIVALDCLNKPTFLWAWFALWSLGAKPAFINTNLRSKAFEHCIRTSTARLLLLDADLEDEILTEETKTELSNMGGDRAVDTVILSQSLEQEILRGIPYRAPDSDRSGDKGSTHCLLIYTSGTTGLPKAAYVDWRKPISGTLFWTSGLEMKPEDRFLTGMPLYHSSASVLGVMISIGRGSTFILAPKFSPRTYMRYASETNATVIQYIGEMCRYLVTSPPTPYDKAHNIRAAFGNGLRPDVWQKFKDRFNIPTIGEFYGATEAPGAAFNLSNNSFSLGAIGKGGLIGRILSRSTQALVRYDHDTDAPIRSPTTNFCTRCPDGEAGELLYQLDPADIKARYQGYHGNDKATSSKLLHDVFVKGDIWYRTGDLIRRDADGRVWFVDRIGDTFRWKAENVSTAEVSEALGSHAALQEANVYGVQLPGHDGRAGCAAIVLTEGKRFDEVLLRDLASHAKFRLPRYAVPIFLRLVKEFEVTGTMKQTKVGLRNDSVDPSKMGEDEVFWLAPGADSYKRFGEKEWQGLSGGVIKL